MRAQPLVIFDGQSFNYAPPDTEGPRTYPMLTWDRLPLGFAACVVGISGTSYATRATTVASRVDPLLHNGAPAVVVDAGGNTDLGADGLTAAQLLAASEAYADARRAAGADYIIELTVTPATALYTAGEDAQRLAYNAALLANANGKFDAVVDQAGIPELADPADTDFYYDGLHLTTEGAELVAELAADTILGVFA